MRDGIEALIRAGWLDFDIARREDVSLGTVRRMRQQLRKRGIRGGPDKARRRKGARITTEWEPPVRAATKMLEPECSN
jgi:transposase